MELEIVLLQILYKEGIIPEEVYLTAIKLLEKEKKEGEIDERSGDISLHE